MKLRVKMFVHWNPNDHERAINEWLESGKMAGFEFDKILYSLSGERFSTIIFYTPKP